MFRSADGGAGQKNNRTGRNGEDCVIEVPAGTIISEMTEEGEKKIVAEILYPDQRMVIASGGEGGRGNARFSRAENRVPLLAEVGEKTREESLHLEVKLLADIGVIGMPNVGKSSLLRAASGAKPTVAEYPFTTLDPVLGVVEKGSERLILVEVPGLVEGAHRGVGLGHEFLRHVARTRVLLHLVDGTSQRPVEDYFQLRTEMGLFDEGLLKKPELVVINKADVPEV
jgi:GTP-binding protein